MFIAEQNGLVGELSTRLIAEGSDVSRYAFDEFPDLFLDAHSNLPPLNLFAKSIDWLRMHFPLASIKPLPLASTGDAAFLLPPLSCETSVEFSSGLWGIYCQPQSASTSAPSVLFCNTGGDPRSGIGGFATRAARSLAEKGIASFRFDFAGLGDSDYTETTRCHVYETPRDLDIQAALDVLAQHGHRRVVIAGICAGAYHALKAGVKDKRIIGILCGSPVKLEWRSGDSLNFNKQILGKSLQSYKTAVLNPQTWARLIRGKIDVVTVASTVGSRWISRIKRRPLKGGTSPLNDIKILNERGVSVEFVAGLGDSSVDELETHFGANYAKLAKLANIRVTVSSEMDHGLARLRSREIVLSRLVQLLTSHDANKPDPQKI